MPDAPPSGDPGGAGPVDPDAGPVAGTTPHPGRVESGRPAGSPPPPPPPRPPPPPSLPLPPPPQRYPDALAPPGSWSPAGPPPGYGPPPSPYARYGVRLAAWLLDWIVASAASAIVLVPLHAVHQSASGANRSFLSGVTVTNQGAILSILVVLIYTTALIGSRRGQSLGMMAVGVKAVDAGARTPIGYGRALGRAVAEYLMFVILIVPWVLDMLFPLWDARRQTLHDKLTNTVVVTAR